MAVERPRCDDTGPFVSLTHQLVYGGPGPQEHDFNIRDRDVTLLVEAGRHTLHLLHLQNVRTDTITAARAAVDDFLNQLDPTDHPKRVENTIYENFDEVRQYLRKYVSAARVEVEELCSEMGGFLQKTPEDLERDPHANNDPVAAVRAACEDFLEKLKLVDDSHEPRKPYAGTMQENYDKAHGEIVQYIEDQAEKRGFNFEWGHGSYPRDSFRSSLSWIKYDVYFREDGKWGTHYGSM